MAKLFRVKAPKLRLTKKGLKLTKPSARIGGKVGINVSSRGVSASARTKLGSISSGKVNPLKTSRKKSAGCFGMLFVATVITVLLIIL